MVEEEKKERITPDKVRARNLNPKPENSIEVSSSLIEVRSGRDAIGYDLEKTYKFTRSSGDKVSANDLLTIVNPDLRLSNLGYNKKDEEMELERASWAFDMMNTCISLGLNKSAHKSQALLLGVTEPSLAKKMALRKNLATIRQESTHTQIEEPPKKKSFFSKFISNKE